MQVISYLPINSPEINSSFVNCYDDANELDASAKAAISVIAIILFLLIIGTCYDFYKQAFKYYKRKVRSYALRTEAKKVKATTGNETSEINCIKSIKIEQSEGILMRILLSFSVYSNLKKIFRSTKSNEQLKCLHPIRFLSMAW